MRENRGSMNRLHLSSVFAGLKAKMQKSQAFQFYARRVGRKVGEKKKNKQTSPYRRGAGTERKRLG